MYSQACKELAEKWGNKYSGKYIYYRVNGKGVYLDIYYANDWDIDTMPPKKDCTLFRYMTSATIAGNMIPVIMINLDRQLVYFWDDNNNTWDTRGTKAENYNLTREA